MTDSLTDSLVIDVWWRRERSEDEWPLYESFPVFLARVWRFLGLPRPTGIQIDIAKYLQHGPKRAIIEAFRGVGKSWITSAFVIWLLLRNAQLNILVVSATKDRADDFTTFTLRLIHEMPEVSHMAPRGSDRSSKIKFDVADAEADHSASVKSAAIMGQITGSRADLIIADDIEVPNNSETAAMRQKLAARVTEFNAIIKPLPSSRIIYLGTPQTEESLYNTLPERGFDMRVWPARFPKPKQRIEYGDTLAPMLSEILEQHTEAAGHPTDPKRFTEEDLMEREASYGLAGFMMQFMLSTQLSDSDRHPLKLSHLVVTDLDRERGPEKVMWSSAPASAWQGLPNVGFKSDRYYRPMDFLRDDHGGIRTREYTGSVMSIDPSGRGKDECAFAVVKMLNSQLFLLRSGAVAGYDIDSLKSLAMVAKEQKVNRIVIETNFGDGMFAALLKPVLREIYPCTVEEVRHSQQKEKRICDTLEPVLGSHRLIVDRQVIEDDYHSTKSRPKDEQNYYRLFYQMSRITRDRGSLRKDDRLDALAIAVAYWVEQMSQDIDQQAEDERMRLLDEELVRFRDTQVFPNKARSEGTGWCGRLRSILS